MSIIQAVFLGLIQGITEFLPVSSSGHLVFFQKILDIESATMTFDIILHLGTLVAVFFVYREDILALIRKPFQRTTYLLIAATIPTVIIALLFGDLIDETFKTGRILGFTFLITAVILYATDKYFKGDTKKKLTNMSFLDAIIVGALQGAATLPGVSRSGMTIAGSLSRGVNKENAAKFSFLLSIIAILGALVLELKDIGSAASSAAPSIGAGPMFVGFVIAAISGYLAIKFMLKVLNNGNLRYFAYYVGALGIFTILDQNIFHIIF